MGRLVLNGQSYTGDEANDHIYGEDPPRPEQGVEGSMYIQYIATKQEDEHGEIIKVPESIVEVYSKIEGEWMPYSGGEVPETHFYSTVIPNPEGTPSTKLTKVNIDGVLFSIDESGSIVIPNKAGTPLYNLDTVEIDGKLYSVNGIGTPVVANPVESASTDLTKIRIDGTPYNIPVNPTEIIANPSGTPSTELQKISINGSLYSIPTTADVEANPSGSATTALNSIGINNTNYYVPVGSMVEANPSTGTAVGSLQRVTIDGSIYTVDGGSGGSVVEANPSDPATVVLRKLGVDGTVYSVEGSGGTDVEGNPSGTATETLNKIRISNTIYDVDGGTTVVANPVGTATDDLTTIQIGNTIYGIEGGGGTLETVFAGSASTNAWASPLVFDGFDLDDYTTLYITATYQGTGKEWEISVNNIPTCDASGNGAIQLEGEVYYGQIDDTYYMFVSTGYSLAVTKIQGLRQGGGGGNVDDVYVNGTSVLDSDKIAQITSYKEVTQAEYDALPASKLTDNVLYCINDQATADTTVAPVIYSTDEREIGVWTDGKPLYQKSFYYSTLPPARGGWALLETLSFSIDTLVKYNVMNQYTDENNNQLGESYWRISYFNNNNSLYYYTPELGNYIEDVYVTIQYTKTTDTPGSGKWAPSGVPAVHYSENEQVVGTWIDGSTLYEKTIKKQNISSVSSSTVLVPSSELTGINIIEIGGSYVSRTSNSIYAINTYINSSTITATWLAEDNIYYWLYWGATDTYDAYITIRYTKQTS